VLLFKLLQLSLPGAQLVAAVGFCAAGLALTWRVERARPMRYVFGAYLLACTAAYLVPSGLGENVVRLRFVAVPLAVLTLSLRRWQPLPVAVAAMALALSWNATPLAFSFARGAADPSANAAYWAPAIGYLRHELRPSYRVEAVDTAGHWGCRLPRGRRDPARARLVPPGRLSPERRSLPRPEQPLVPALAAPARRRLRRTDGGTARLQLARRGHAPPQRPLGARASLPRGADDDLRGAGAAADRGPGRAARTSSPSRRAGSG